MEPRGWPIGGGFATPLAPRGGSSFNIHLQRFCPAMANTRVRSRLGDFVLEPDSFLRHPLLHEPAEKSLLGELCVLQAEGGVGVHTGDFHGEIGSDGEFLEGKLGVSKEDCGEVEVGAEDVLARGRVVSAAEPVHGGGKEGGKGYDVWRHQ
jgi:hypothetical protein